MELPDIVLGHVLGTTKLRDLATEPRCEHNHTTDTVAAYIVRHTIAPDGTLINADQPRMGRDVAIVPTSNCCANELALVIARGYRAGKGWAVIDCVWPCGHRS